MLKRRIVSDLTPFSLIDYPDKLSCIVWFVGCNMRCSYCYNPEIVFGKGRISLSEVLDFAETRRGLLDGVVLSGGECTLHKEILPFASALKEKGMLVKVDTNGSNPGRIQELISQNLIDYVALDFKSSPAKFREVTGLDGFREVERTLQLLLRSKVPFELRTTYHSGILNENDLFRITDYICNAGYEGTYYIQNYIDRENTVGKINNNHRRISSFPQSRVKIAIRN